MEKLIEMIKAAGFTVYRRRAHDNHVFYTDGTRIGYAQFHPMRGYSISSVHQANRTSGTGFEIEREVFDIDSAMLKAAFCHAPAWADRPSRESVVKYRGMAAYLAASDWNASLMVI